MNHSTHLFARHIRNWGMCFILMMGLVAGMVAQDDCSYDLNGDGVTAFNELLFFLTDYGVAGNTDYDFNDNGIRDFEDALMLSRHLGTQCPQTEVQDTAGIILGLLTEPMDTLTQDLSDGVDTISLQGPSHTDFTPWSAIQRSPLSVFGEMLNSP